MKKVLAIAGILALIFTPRLSFSDHLEPRESEIHIDHSFDYRHIIIYLDDSDGDTIMYNSKHRIVDRSSPKEDKVILFGKCQHSGEFPIKHPKRTILVATFS